MTAVPGPHLPTPTTSFHTSRTDDGMPNSAALPGSREAGIAVTVALTLLTTVVCALLGSLTPALLALVAVAGIAGLTIAGLTIAAL